MYPRIEFQIHEVCYKHALGIGWDYKLPINKQFNNFGPIINIQTSVYAALMADKQPKIMLAL